MLEEARCLARIAHPNVVAVHEVGRVGDQVYLVMELVDGPNLGRWARGEADGRARTAKEIVTAIVAAGRGLAAVHDAGLLHGDVKPSNILVGPDDRVRVADFGLARFVFDGGHGSGGDLDRLVDRALAVSAGSEDEPDSDAGPEGLSEFDQALGELRSLLGEDLVAPHCPRASVEPGLALVGGTRPYMPPELLDWGSREPQPGSPAADQYSLCATAWEALFGAAYPGYGQGHGWGYGRGYGANARALCPPAVVAVLRRGLAERPEARWPSIDALCAALERARDRPARLASHVRSLLLSTALVLSLAVGFVGYTRSLDPIPDSQPTCEQAGRAMLSQWRSHRHFLGRHQSRALEHQRPDPEGSRAPLDSALTRRLDRWVADWASLWQNTCGEDLVVQRCLERERGRFDAVLATAAEIELSHLDTALMAELGSPLDCLDAASVRRDGLDAERLHRIATLAWIEHRIELAVLGGNPRRAAHLIRGFDRLAGGLAEHRLAIEPWRARVLAAMGDEELARVRLRQAIGEAEARGEDPLRFALLLAQARLGGHEQMTLDEFVVLEGLAEHVDPSAVARAELGLVRASMHRQGRSAVDELAVAEAALRREQPGRYVELRLELLVRRAQLHFDAGELADALQVAEQARELMGLRALGASEGPNRGSLTFLQLPASMPSMTTLVGSDADIVAASLVGITAALLGDCDRVRPIVEALWAANERTPELALRDVSLGLRRQVDWTAVRRACPYTGGDLYALFQ